MVGALNGLIGFSQSSMKTNEYTIKPELLHLKWIHSRIPVKEGYIVLKLNAEGESTIDIPAGCTVRIIKKDRKEATGTERTGRVQLPVEGLSVE